MLYHITLIQSGCDTYNTRKKLYNGNPLRKTYCATNIAKKMYQYSKYTHTQMHILCYHTWSNRQMFLISDRYFMISLACGLIHAAFKYFAY